MSENKGIAGLFVMGDGLQQASRDHATQPAYWPFTSQSELRAYVECIVRSVLEDDAREIRENKAFQPTVIVNTHEHRRVEMTEESGKQWRGVLYRVDALPVDEHSTDPELPAVNTPAGTCWACGEHGESGAMMWLDRFGRRSHLVHATPECVRAAELKPEQREHRG